MAFIASSASAIEPDEKAIELESVQLEVKSE